MKAKKKKLKRVTWNMFPWSLKVKFTQSCPTFCDSHGLYSPWNFPGQNTGVGSRSLLQGIFLTQGSNPGLPRCKQILYQMTHPGSSDVYHDSFPCLFPMLVTWKIVCRTSKSPSKICCCLVAKSCLTLWPHGLCSSWNSPVQKTGVGHLSLLQGIFLTQGSNLGLPHCRSIL